jgi:hypothetical protein
MAAARSILRRRRGSIRGADDSTERRRRRSRSRTTAEIPVPNDGVLGWQIAMASWRRDAGARRRWQVPWRMPARRGRMPRSHAARPGRPQWPVAAAPPTSCATHSTRTSGSGWRRTTRRRRTRSGTATPARGQRSGCGGRRGTTRPLHRRRRPPARPPICLGGGHCGGSGGLACGGGWGGGAEPLTAWAEKIVWGRGARRGEGAGRGEGAEVEGER